MSGQEPTSEPTKQPRRDRWNRVRVWLVMAVIPGAAAVAIAGTVIDHPTTDDLRPVPRWTSC